MKIAPKLLLENLTKHLLQILYTFIPHWPISFVATRRENSKSAEKLRSVDKSSIAAKSEMLGVFISSFDEVGKHVFKELILFVEVSSMASETAMAALAEILKHQDMDIKQICLWYLIP